MTSKRSNPAVYNQREFPIFTEKPDKSIARQRLDWEEQDAKETAKGLRADCEVWRENDERSDAEYLADIKAGKIPASEAVGTCARTAGVVMEMRQMLAAEYQRQQKRINKFNTIAQKQEAE